MIYDAIIIGGGVAGSTLATGLAECGRHVLVLERETTFKDRVRGEALIPWGVAEARRLGIDQVLLQGCAQEIRWFETWADGAVVERRDLLATTPQSAGCLTFSHPAMQRLLLDRAEATGAEVHRGATVRGVATGELASVAVRENGGTRVFHARLIVGADGRAAQTRSWGHFAVQRAPERVVIASVLLSGMPLPPDAMRVTAKSAIGQGLIVVPVGDGRFRPYLMSRKHRVRRKLHGSSRLTEFLQACSETGMPAAWTDGAEQAGPLAEFEAAHIWVDHPYQHGIALVGDAAGSSDPSYGTGLSLTLRDVRVLRDQLLTTDDWDAAAQSYAAERDGYYTSLRRIESWLTDMFYEVGPEADARRAHALPLLRAEPERGLDLLSGGPDLPSDELTRRRFFGEV